MFTDAKGYVGVKTFKVVRRGNTSTDNCPHNNGYHKFTDNGSYIFPYADTVPSFPVHNYCSSPNNRSDVSYYQKTPMILTLTFFRHGNTNYPKAGYKTIEHEYVGLYPITAPSPLLSFLQDTTGAHFWQKSTTVPGSKPHNQRCPENRRVP